MNAIERTALILISIASAVLVAGPATAQTITGTPGSPSATTTLQGDQLPPPPPKFGGKIERDAAQSKPYWPPRVEPGKGAPNVLLIITDDTGYGTPSTFGGVIPTPTLDRVAANGLRYTNFHSTSLCSPTRAALITGRNHHSAGFGVISEQSSATWLQQHHRARQGDDRPDAERQRLPHVLVGKDHNVLTFQASQDGPFDQWPIGMGFEYFYGFIGGDANQWAPNLFRNTTQIYPFLGKPGWNLTTAMADDAIAYMNRINALSPDQPFFIKYAPGGVHAPHHPTPEWIKKISDMHLFDEGWNSCARRFSRTRKLGVIPPNAKLTPWPKDLLKDRPTSADDKKMFVRQVDIFAYVAYTDHEIGRVIQAVEDMGKLDNTLSFHQWRQRRQRRGHADRNAQRGREFQWRQRAGRRPAQGLLRRLGL